MVVSSI